MKARLIAARELAPDICHFEFESADWPLDFAPGQFVSLTKDGITRAYSVASPPSLTPDSKTGSGRFALCANLCRTANFHPSCLECRQATRWISKALSAPLY